MADNTPLKRYGQPEEVASNAISGSEDGSLHWRVYMCDGGVGGRSLVG